MQYIPTAGDWKQIDTSIAKNPLIIDTDAKRYPKIQVLPQNSLSMFLSKLSLQKHISPKSISTIATLALYIGLRLYIQSPLLTNL